MPSYCLLFLCILTGSVGATTITDFSYWSPSSAYGSWAAESSPKMRSGEQDWSITSTGFGGVYKYLGSGRQAVNLSDATDLKLELILQSQSNGTKGIGFFVFLEDRDGTVYKYSRFGVQAGQQTLAWNLKTPSSLGDAGTVAGFDFSDVQAINLVIDAGGANHYEVSYQNLSASIGVASDQQAMPNYITRKAIPYIDQPDDPRYANCVLDLYYPENVQDFATVVWIHAGGLKQGKRYIPGELMNQGFAVVAISYSLYPSAKAPEFIEDAAAAVAWTFSNIESIGGDPEKIVVAGASAGGYLSMMVGLDKKWLAEFGMDANRLAGIAALSGQTITHVAVREEQGGNRAKPVVDALAPLNHVRADAPPLLLVTGDRELELLGRYEENAYMWRMMQINGHTQTQLHEIKGADHAAVEKPGHQFLLEFVKELLTR